MGLVFKMGGFTALGLKKFASLTETERTEKATKKIEALLLSSSKGGGGALGQVSTVEEVRSYTSSIRSCTFFYNLIVYLSQTGPVHFH